MRCDPTVPSPARRRILLGLAAALLAGCRSRRAAAPPSGAWRRLDFAPGAVGSEPQQAELFAPAGVELPLLVALHGRGESGRGLEVGARAWRDDYDLERAHAALLAPPLDPDDFLGFVRPERLAQLNASLAAAPFRAIGVACPYTPDLPDRSAAGAAEYGRFVVERLVPRAASELGRAGGARRAGIDGVSMGGRLSLLVGLSHPDVFSSVGALQPALRPGDGPELARLARAARARAPVRLRLVSSDGDPFLAAISAVSDQLRAEGVDHELLVVPGPHDYVWNRGPGAVEMLAWHERALRDLASP